MPDAPPARETIDAILTRLVALYTDNRRLTKRVAARARLTGPQLVVVKLLEQVGAMSLSELSTAMRSGNSTLTGIALRMEREGLVRRERDDDDRRVVRLTLTARGRRAAAEVPLEPIGIWRRALGVLSADDARALLRITERLSAAVRAFAADELAAPATPKSPVVSRVRSARSKSTARVSRA